MCHKTIYIFNRGIQSFQFFNKYLNILFFKIQFASVILGKNIPT